MNQIHSNPIFNKKNYLDSQYNISLRCYDLTTLYIIVDSRLSQFLSLRDLTLPPHPLFFSFWETTTGSKKKKESMRHSINIQLQCKLGI